LVENEIRKLSVKTLAETNRLATSQTSVSGELLRVRNDEITRNNRDAIVMRKKKHPPVNVRTKFIRNRINCTPRRRRARTKGIEEATHKSPAWTNASGNV